MPSAQEEQLDANISLLLSIHFEGMDPDTRQNLMDSMQVIRDDYDVAAAKGKRSKYYKDLGDAIAKSLPGIVKGAMSASEAFKKGDYITGTAALMDICASVIPVLASLASAAGPEGALVGALFSVVGQILSFFAPKQPSLEDKIQKMLNHVQSEEQIRTITAVGHGISSYARSLRSKCTGIHRMEAAAVVTGTLSVTPGSAAVQGSGTAFNSTVDVGQWLTFDADTSQRPYKIDAINSHSSLTLALPYAGTDALSTAARQFKRTVEQRGIAEILAMPLTTEQQADDFLVEMKELHWGLMRDQEKLDAPVFANWEVAGYLERPENQGKEGWPEVLGIWCRTYIDLLTANVMLQCLADPKTLDRLINDTRSTNAASPLSQTSKDHCHTALLNLKAVASTLRHGWESDKDEMLKIVRKVRGPARERGRYAQLGYWQNGNVLYVAPGDGTSKRLNWNYKSNTGWLHTISIHVPAAQRDSFAPTYEVVSCELRTGNSRPRIRRYGLDAVTGGLFSGVDTVLPRDDRGDNFLDVCGIAVGDESGFPGQTTLLAIAIEDRGAKPYACINLYTVDGNNQSTRLVDWEPHVALTQFIRCLRLPPTALADDPDADALRNAAAHPSGPALQGATPAVIYGGARDGQPLWMMVEKAAANVPLPAQWTGCNGIEVDPHHVWIFGKHGIACATHASLVKWRQGSIPGPSWMVVRFDKPFDHPEVESLSVCADGTLFAAMQGGGLYSGNYDIDHTQRSIAVSDWVDRGGDAKQVVKLVIPCWQVLESLRASLVSH